MLRWLPDLHVVGPHREFASVVGIGAGQRQALAIAHAAGWGTDVMIMDEPTAALGDREGRAVEDLIVRLREKRRCLLVLSHNFEQVIRFSGHVYVTRPGRPAARPSATCASCACGGGPNCCGTPTSPSNVIAHRVGFASRSNSRAFTEQFGRSPTLVQSGDG